MRTFRIANSTCGLIYINNKALTQEFVHSNEISSGAWIMVVCYINVVFFTSHVTMKLKETILYLLYA